MISIVRVASGISDNPKLKAQGRHPETAPPVPRELEAVRGQGRYKRASPVEDWRHWAPDQGQSLDKSLPGERNFHQGVYTILPGDWGSRVLDGRP